MENNLRFPAPGGNPVLSRLESGGVAWWGDEGLLSVGVTIAFSERAGGVSDAPFDSLDLAAHVGDDPAAVDENRLRLLDALGLTAHRSLLTVPEQVHGEHIAMVSRANAGSGAFADSGPLPLQRTDALLTIEPGVPLMLCFADCVPVVLVAPGPAVAVAHAGWRGALAGLPGKTAKRLAREARCEPDEILAYVGAHIRACHYEVSDETMSQFVNTFGTVARAESGGLDLAAVVNRNLIDAGVPSCSIASLGACTAEETDRFFSYRASGGRTGRHAALACILPPSA
jgi:YfiH family protein